MTRVGFIGHLCTGPWLRRLSALMLFLILPKLWSLNFRFALGGPNYAAGPFLALDLRVSAMMYVQKV